MLKFIKWGVLTALCVSANAMAQQIPQNFSPEKIEAIETLIEERLQSTGTPGAALTLFENGQIVYAKGFGRADEAGREITPDTPFNLGSLTKSFTSLAITQLAEEGRVDLDIPIVRYLPDFQTTDKPVSDKITVRHLMGHKSGFSTLDGNRNQVQSNATPTALADAVAGLRSVKLDTEPGTAFAYSNANYQILGALLENLDGVSYEKSIETRILTPMKMRNSFALNNTVEANMPAAPFRFIFSKPHRYSPPAGPLGRETIAQGGMFASTNDLAHYIMDVSSDMPTLISPEGAKSLTALTSDFEQERGRGYGLGWFVRKHDDYTQVYHSGLSPGYQSLAGFVPERQLGFVILTNASGGYAYGHVGGLTGGVMDLVLDKSPRTAVRPPSNKRTLWILMLVPVGVVFWALRSLRGLRRRKPVWMSARKWTRAVRYGVPSLGLLGLAWALAVQLPNAAGAPLSAAIQFNPDIGMVLAIAAFTCGVWALARVLVLWLRMKD